jgi:hypothetical protein
VQADYSRQNQKSQDKDHGNNLFDYGYLGKFTSTRIPTYDFLTGKQTGFQVVNVDLRARGFEPDRLRV